MEVTFFSSNPAKIDEARRIFSNNQIDINVKHFNFLEIQDLSHERVLLHKASQLEVPPNHIYVLDDTGLYLETYKYFPGVMSKFIYETLGYEGFLKLLEAEGNRRGYFKALVAVKAANNTEIFEGLCEGEIASSSRGKEEEGLLFEPLFVPTNSSLTLAEMTQDQRLEYSYRAKALDAAIGYVKSLLSNANNS